MDAKSLQFCLTLWDPMDCSPPGSSTHGIQQARILEWVAVPSSLGIFPTQESNLGLWHCREILYCWATGVMHITSPSWPFLLPSPSHLLAELPVLKSSIHLDILKSGNNFVLLFSHCFCILPFRKTFSYFLLMHFHLYLDVFLFLFLSLDFPISEIIQCLFFCNEHTLKFCLLPENNFADLNNRENVIVATPGFDLLLQLRMKIVITSAGVWGKSRYAHGSCQLVTWPWVNSVMFYTFCRWLSYSSRADEG